MVWRHRDDDWSRGRWRYADDEEHHWRERDREGDPERARWGREYDYGKSGYARELPEMFRGSWTAIGPFRGRGPRGYRRSDERIREDVYERLTWHPALDASGIEPSVQDGEVTLRGVVDSRQAKRLAEEAIETISGVRDVHNELRISESHWQPTAPARPEKPAAAAEQSGH